ncbi:RICIN domain-containing protein [Microbispora sp. GKU 823]|uniref:RICIN domain-containing protein n=1 Tax=Microbispora sp. GKU 823 TaxID=1652100 RepID=UPI00277B548F|nr:RICIN domain-containing protein [Microbispora sp. GKU 823]
MEWIHHLRPRRQSHLRLPDLLRGARLGFVGHHVPLHRRPLEPQRPQQLHPRLAAADDQRRHRVDERVLRLLDHRHGHRHVGRPAGPAELHARRRPVGPLPRRRRRRPPPTARPPRSTTATAAAGQKWSLTSSGELRTFGATKCLDVFDQKTTAGATVGIWDCNGGANQKWTLNSTGTIVGVQSGLCLDVNGNQTANGAKVQIWTCNGGANQRWTPA